VSQINAIYTNDIYCIQRYKLGAVYIYMCGIVGYLGTQPFPEYVLQGLQLLQNRGYDSVGIGFIYDVELRIVKRASNNTHNAINTVSEELLRTPGSETSTIAIGHTRWATHGGKTDANAHPHTDNSKKIAVVHNGIIECFKELKTELMQEGYHFDSQTDTEVIAVLIGKYIDGGANSVKEAIQLAIKRLSGTWALVIIHSDFPHTMWITRNGSPLLLGMEDDYVVVASEQIAFGNFIKNYVFLDNHDLIEVSKDRITGTMKYTSIYKEIGNYMVNQKTDTHTAGGIETMPPAKYQHWMLKEIEEQRDAIFRAMNHGGRIQAPDAVKLGGLDACKTRLLELNHLILLGCGTSLHAGWWSLEIFKSLGILDTVTLYDGAEFQKRDIPRNGNTGIVLLSQSGETKDLHRCIQLAKEEGLMTIGIVNVVDSLIARETECGVYLNAGREVAVASTKSFTNQCVLLAMVAVWFSQNRGSGTSLEKRRQIISDLQKLPHQIPDIMENDSRLKRVVLRFQTARSLFLLGKGSAEAIAKEGSLKIKEVTYIHAEGYSSSALKHGAFALICDHLPIIVLDISEEHRAKNRSAIEEVTARNAYVLRITEDANTIESVEQLLIPKNKTFAGILANIYIQYISYYLAVELGYNPDYPRNLAKVVTVD